MGLKDIAPVILNDRKRIVQHQTWGHLFPEKDKVFFGTIRVAQSAYGDLIVLKDTSGVPSSPWWYESLMEFTSEFLIKHDKPGVVFEIQTKCKVVSQKDGEIIKITSMGYMEVLK